MPPTTTDQQTPPAAPVATPETPAPVPPTDPTAAAPPVATPVAPAGAKKSMNKKWVMIAVVVVVLGLVVWYLTK